MQFDDAYQEAYLKFLELQQKYPKVDSPQHFMGLYKTALANRMTDFSKSATRIRRADNFTDLEMLRGEDNEVIPYQETLVGDSDLQALFEIKLDEVPSVVRQVLNLMVNSRPDMLEAMSDSWFDQGKRKDGGNQFLCRLLGYDHRKTDAVEQVVDFLTIDDEDLLDEYYGLKKNDDRDSTPPL